MSRVVAAVLISLGLGIGGSAGAQTAPEMTNQDVVDMVKAKLAEATILAAIRGAKPKFDTSAAACSCSTPKARRGGA